MRRGFGGVARRAADPTVTIPEDRDAWTTPIEIVQLVWRVFEVDLDPCSNRFSKVNARTSWTISDDGLAQDWNVCRRPCIYMNPPFSAPGPWMRMLRAMAESNGANAIACVKSDTSTTWFRDCWSARAICFPWRRVKFDPPPSVKASTPNFPVAFPCWGDDGVVARFTEVFAELGKVVPLSDGPTPTPT